jgi:ankyrin repeat protein
MPCRIDRIFATRSGDISLVMKRIALVGILWAIVLVAGCTENAADLDDQLIEATRHFNLRQVSKLLEKGADVDARNARGGTPLMHAAYHGNLELCRLLIEKGADLNAKASNGTTAIMLAALNGWPQVMELLVANEADVNAQKKDGTTALYFAAFRGRAAAAKILIKSGADVNAQRKDGLTPLIAAVIGGGHLDVVKALVAAGANANVVVKGVTALDLAKANGHSKVAKYLETREAD